MRREAAEVDFDVASMDDPERFGPVFHRLSFAEAIARGLLADYRVAVVGVDDATYRSYAERGRFVTIDGVTVTDARSLAGTIGLAKAMRGYDLRRVVSFHNRVVGARAFAASLPDVISWMPADERPAGELWTHLISGEMTSGERDVLLGRFRSLEDGERGLLSNARCLAEGVDVPAIDGVAFLDPRRSQVDVVQAVGRAIRRSPDKTHGTIVLPVFVDTDADPQAALEASAFRPVWEVLKALRAHDELLAEQLDALRRELGRRGRGEIRLPAKIAVDLPEAVDEAFARAFRVRLVEQATSSWEASFGALEDYVVREGHTQVPKDHVEQGIPIWRWMGKQRVRRKRGDLTPERVKRLEALAGWQWEPYEEQWEEAVARLERFADREGHARVPAKHIEDGLRLGQWVNAVRTQHTRGELSSERVRRLDAVPGWAWNGRVANWDEGFRLLTCYVERERHARVPHGHVEDGFNLGNWVVMNRQFQAKRKLPEGRVERLELLPGWSWDTLDEAWEQGFAHLQRYASREQHARVPLRHREDELKLGQWVARQRQQRAKMDPERAQRLEQVPGWAWDTLEAAWDRAFTQLQTFAEREGHARVPGDHAVGDLRLGSWVDKQRTAWRNGRLSPDRVTRLEAVPGWEWDPDGAAWERFFRRLVAFAETHGHTAVPQQFVDGDVHLGRWLANQRTAFTAGRLDQDRIDRLAALPGWTWTPRETAWEERLARLRRFIEREGHANVVGSEAHEDFKLGTWVQRQRQAYRTGGLALDRVRRLEEVPGWWWEDAADPWEDSFARLSVFVERERHARVPGDHEEGGFDLGGWVSRQRQAKRAGQLADERERRLEVLPGWSWRPKADQWEEGYAVLQAFVAREHHAHVERDHVEDGFKLGAWVVEQRQAYRQARSRPERAERLAALPGWAWSRRDDWWEQGYAHLLRYAEREGHTHVPIDHRQDGFKLGRWVVNQRVRAREMPDRARRLEAIPGWTWSGKGQSRGESDPLL